MLNAVDLAGVDLNLLVLFEAVLEEGHVGRAAQRLHVSPSAVSHGLGRLRRTLGDPLFLRTPKGVVPTARADDLALPIADVLARVRSVIATARPFDPSTSRRRFTVAAPDATSAVFLPPLLDEIQRAAPGIDVGIRQLLPVPGETTPENAWRPAFEDLEARATDVAILPSDQIPVRFVRRTVYEEDFVVAVRAGHAFVRRRTLERYCALAHVVVSLAGDPYGFVDRALEGRGHARRVALTVPNFLMALAVLAETDLISTLPRAFVAVHGPRFGVVAVEPPLPLDRFRLNAVMLQAAKMDAGLAWLFDLVAPAERRPRPRTSRR
jgi:DNA-binding transcriptional LysR family regulator